MMKKIYFTIAATIISLAGLSQSFTVTADTIEGTYDVSMHPVDYNWVLNTTDNPLNLSWDLLTYTILSNGWSITLCTLEDCTPNVPSTGFFGNLPVGGQGYFMIHMNFNKIPGTGEISFRLYETLNPSNADTVSFIYHATLATAVVDNTKDPGISIFPNPAKHNVNVAGTAKKSNISIIIYTVNGSQIMNESTSTTDPTIDVSDFPNGLYLLEIRENSSLLYSTKFVKD